MDIEPTDSARKRYEALEVERKPFLDRARQAAGLTLPFICPPEGHNRYSDLPTPHQSLGARGVTNLASKLSLALFPPHQPFFQLTIDERTLKSSAGADNESVLKVKEGLSAMEQAALKRAEIAGLRPSMHEAMVHAVVNGNIMIYVGSKDLGTRLFPLDCYVVRRNASGSLLEFVTKEDIAKAELPEEVRAALPEKRTDTQKITQEPDAQEMDDSYALYTWGQFIDKKWRIVQQVEDIPVGETATVKPKDFRYIPLRLNRVTGEDYGRGFVEQYLGDLVRLDGLAEAMLEAAVAASRVLPMVNPNGLTDIKDVTQAENLEAIVGRADDVSFLQMEKYADMRVALETVRDIERRLEFAFLLNTAIQRSGERVTAHEIQTMAQELEDALGGVYSLFSVDLQEPLARLIVDELEGTDGYPKLPDEIVSLKIVTGIDALGRAHEGHKLDQFVAEAAQALGPEVVASMLHPEEFLRRKAASMGIPTDGLVLSQEEVQQQQAQAQMQSLTEKAAGPVAGQLAGAAAQQIQQEAI